MTDLSSKVPFTQASAIGIEAAHATWALAARQHLAETARIYHAVVTTNELAEAVQELSRIQTRQQPRHWLGDVLYRVAQECGTRREPLLPALCVDERGHVARGYADWVGERYGVRPDDPDRHAAEERLDCYRAFGADIPAGGGTAVPAPQAARPARPARTSTGSATRSTSTRSTSTRSRSAGPPTTKPRTPASRPLEVTAPLCPTCFTELPASGHCDYCD